jgi:hypothetical protein
MVEFQSSKLATWVRFPSPAPIFSNLVSLFYEAAQKNLVGFRKSHALSDLSKAQF